MYVSQLPYEVHRQFSTKEGIMIEKPVLVKDIGDFMCEVGTIIRQIQEMISKANK